MQLQASFSFFLILTFCQELCSEPRKVPRKSLLPVCKLPMKRGNCRAIFTRWFYDSYAERCEQFYYGGCRGNKNNFLNKEQCEIVCRGT
ncbi:kunitz-type protease inhibitor 3 [Meriones unguiculatus]|uniref:kunitz-type protease inhibitor 3 n=1 Tax=Meriones unguiculatus TaxID=10047 RepID=UPI000B4E9877|nr:kunitz-type protease inhibitor 3 [Meriones unguiculatus]